MNAVSLIKNLPTVGERPKLIRQIITANVMFYAGYKLSSGPQKVRLARDLTLTPESGPQTLVTYHFCHTSLFPLLFNCGIMSTIGSNLVASHGTARFLRLFGACATGSAFFAAYDVRNNAN